MTGKVSQKPSFKERNSFYLLFALVMSGMDLRDADRPPRLHFGCHNFTCRVGSKSKQFQELWQDVKQHYQVGT